MKNYIVVYERGNGYHCHCCRQSWEEIEHISFENKEELTKHIEEHNALYKKDCNTYDSRAVSAYEIVGDGPVYPE